MNKTLAALLMIIAVSAQAATFGENYGIRGYSNSRSG